MGQPILQYHRPPAGRTRQIPVLGVTSCILAVIGLIFVCLPIADYAVLEAVKAGAVGYFVIGAGIGVTAISLRAESLHWAITGICLHFLSAVIWFGIGGWAYFGAGP